jgi:hypothetical protein
MPQRYPRPPGEPATGARTTWRRIEIPDYALQSVNAALYHAISLIHAEESQARSERHNTVGNSRVAQDNRRALDQRIEALDREVNTLHALRDQVLEKIKEAGDA